MPCENKLSAQTQAPYVCSAIMAAVALLNAGVISSGSVEIRQLIPTLDNNKLESLINFARPTICRSLLVNLIINTLRKATPISIKDWSRHFSFTPQTNPRGIKLKVLAWQDFSKSRHTQEKLNKVATNTVNTLLYPFLD